MADEVVPHGLAARGTLSSRVLRGWDLNWLERGSRLCRGGRVVGWRRWQEGAGSVQRGLRFFFRFSGIPGAPVVGRGRPHAHRCAGTLWPLSSPWPLGPHRWGARLLALSSWLLCASHVGLSALGTPPALTPQGLCTPVPPGPSPQACNSHPHCLQVSPLRKGTSSERPSLTTSHKIATLHGPLLLFPFFFFPQSTDHCLILFL